MLRSTLLVILFAFSGAAFADDFNYNSVTVSYGQIDFDDLNADGDTLGINGSAAVSENFHVFASYGVGEVDDGIDTLDVDTWNAGIGYNTSLSESVDLVVGLSYEYIDLSAPGFGSVDDNGFGVSVGLRMAASDKLEIDAGIAYVDMSDNGDNTAFGGGLLYSFTENFALGLSASFDDDVTAYNIGGRFYFGN
jgi:opacity protein-like surface antigen